MKLSRLLLWNLVGVHLRHFYLRMLIGIVLHLFLLLDPHPLTVLDRKFEQPSPLFTTYSVRISHVSQPIADGSLFPL